MRYAAFFEYARKRHQIYLDRAAGSPAPWTRDKILRQYRFCNVYRELDKVTTWFREHVRAPLAADPKVLLATVVFRMFNSIRTGEAMFCQPSMITGRTLFDDFTIEGDWRDMWKSIEHQLGGGPYVNGAYIISSPPGKLKLEGVAWILGQFWLGDWREFAQNPIGLSLEMTWEWLREFPYLGKFHSYEIVTDLRHTCILGGASDVCTWANPGPGARRGLNRVHGRDLNLHPSRTQMIGEMVDLLRISRDEWCGEWPKWEMREVEHTLCEFDKYERARLGQGRPKQIFRGENR